MKIGHISSSKVELFQYIIKIIFRKARGEITGISCQDPSDSLDTTPLTDNGMRSTLLFKKYFLPLNCSEPQKNTGKGIVQQEEECGSLKLADRFLMMSANTTILLAETKGIQ